ncbi:7154_t:CDS:1, partial [Dentiscutata heterogama]
SRRYRSNNSEIVLRISRAGDVNNSNNEEKSDSELIIVMSKRNKDILLPE